MRAACLPVKGCGTACNKGWLETLRVRKILFVLRVRLDMFQLDMFAYNFCTIGATVVNILIPGTIKSFGVLQLEFNSMSKSSASASSGVVALCYFLYSSLGPLSSILSVKWSYRTVTLLGGSFAAVGMILSRWASSISYLYFSFGALVGAGAGLAFPPTVYIVTSYFVRLRGLANGICMSGSAFGSIILPPVLRYLLEEYCYSGAVLILGGIMLNVWAAALLFQPVEQHMVRKYKDVEEDEEPPQVRTAK
ncbi:Monocarboxylate transporter 12 [Eumeta japonica]|uniref:Monocarboxylate transporter 12 n=1 Tax=Eumeta variegata TaxID=151549 RepID=A0A4C1Y1K4_EUMVA|nr:Monocarboxylate transporter 12 [Eumeta japonica]